VANATVVPSRDGRRHAIVHFEVTVESFRRAFESDEDEYAVYVVDRRTGRVIIDGGHPQRNGAPLGRPADGRFRTLAADTGDRGLADVDGHRAAYDSVDRAAGNANDWIVVARSTEPPPTLLGDLGVIPIGIAALALLLMLFGATGLRAQRQELLSAAETDGLTGLPNRRRLIADLDRRIPRAGEGAAVLMLFDLNGFKDYNDAFGHLAGDALLARLGHALSTALGARGIAYRLGGDEFCVLCGAHDRVAIERDALEALSESGEGFDVTASHGVVALPDEAADTIEALRLADQRMYAAKQGGRATAGRQSKDVLLRALAERHPDLGEHNDGVAELAVAVAERLGLTEDDVARVRLAAELHDVGKVAIPDAILDKPGPLDDEEWAFMRRHTLIGERILAAAPSLLPVGRLVRASHERWDGGGYPDGLAGTAIPLGARIVAVADAFDAMTTNRPYSKARTAAVALAELRRCAGTQFDAEIVALFETVVFERLAPADASLAA
jgi:diguanylate cyclase (GGDEF)-like protein